MTTKITTKYPGQSPTTTTYHGITQCRTLDDLKWAMLSADDGDCDVAGIQEDDIYTLWRVDDGWFDEFMAYVSQQTCGQVEIGHVAGEHFHDFIAAGRNVGV